MEVHKCRSRSCAAPLPAREPGQRGRPRDYCNDTCKRREKERRLKADAKAYRALKRELLGR